MNKIEAKQLDYIKTETEKIKIAFMKLCQDPTIKSQASELYKAIVEFDKALLEMMAMKCYNSASGVSSSFIDDVSFTILFGCTRASNRIDRYYARMYYSLLLDYRLNNYNISKQMMKKYMLKDYEIAFLLISPQVIYNSESVKQIHAKSLLEKEAFEKNLKRLRSKICAGREDFLEYSNNPRSITYLLNPCDTVDIDLNNAEDILLGMILRYTDYENPFFPDYASYERCVIRKAKNWWDSRWKIFNSVDTWGPSGRGTESSNEFKMDLPILD